MISVVIPTLNAQERLGLCLEALVPAVIEGLVKEALIVDAGSSDATLAIADDAGARVIEAPRGRGQQLAAGGAAARGDWLLFLHADSILEPSWTEEAHILMRDENLAGVFTLKFDQDHWRAKLVASGAMIRARTFSLPYGDQGLLISRSLYNQIGGYSPWALFEDVDLMERLVSEKGRKALKFFKTRIVTSAERYERNGYARQVMHNFSLLMRYKFGAPPERLARKY